MLRTFIFIVATAFVFQYFYKTETIQVNEVKHDNVILYATSWCGYCKKTRAFLSENKINYIEYDIEQSEEGRKQHQALGGNGVPVLDIKGTVIYGYSVKNMKSVFETLHLM